MSLAAETRLPVEGRGKASGDAVPVNVSRREQTFAIHDGVRSAHAPTVVNPCPASDDGCGAPDDVPDDIVSRLVVPLFDLGEESQ